MKRSAVRSTLQENLGFKCWHGQGNRMPGAHTHLEIEANLIRQGTISYLFGGNRVDVTAGEWAIFWGSIPHQLVALEEGSEISWFTLPLSRFLGWDLPRSLSGLLLDGKVIKERATTRDALNFADWEADLNSGAPARLQIVELEMEARLRRLSLDLPSLGNQIQNASSGELGHIEKLAAFMAKHYMDAIQTEDIAAAAGIHPNYAMNLFKRGFGLSLGEFLTRTRLAQVQRLLVTTDRNVLDIALDCGFGSASRFHAAFKKHCGLSPAEYRKSLL